MSAEYICEKLTDRDIDDEHQVMTKSHMALCVRWANNKSKALLAIKKDVIVLVILYSQ
jgi:hypothetical protein